MLWAFFFFLLVVVVIIIIACVVKGIPLVPPATSLPIEHFNTIDPKKVFIYMVATPEVGNYANHSININNEYAKKHGYRFQVFTKNATPDLPINFSKIQNALDIMNSNDAPEYIVHLDADAVVVRPEYPITNIINHYMLGAGMIIGEDCYDKSICSKPGQINSGVFIVKNSTMGRKILNRWLNSARGTCSRYVNQFPNCQLVFGNCVLPALRMFINIIPYNVMNGKDGLFIQHLMQHTSNERIEFFKKVGRTQMGRRMVF